MDILLIIVLTWGLTAIMSIDLVVSMLLSIAIVKLFL